MCRITATELKNNLGKYLELAQTEDVYITKNNRVITVLTNPQEKAFYELMKFRDDLHFEENFDADQALEEEILKR